MVLPKEYITDFFGTYRLDFLDKIKIKIYEYLLKRLKLLKVKRYIVFGK